MDKFKANVIQGISVTLAALFVLIVVFSVGTVIALLIYGYMLIWDAIL